MKILFAGTPEIAVPVLRALASRKLVTAVLTNPDKRGCRGSQVHCCPVKAAALEHGLPVLQPEHLGREAREAVARYGCDTLVCFAYGRLFGPKFLALFPNGRLNVHPSLLPAFRGSAPIQWAILTRQAWTGISIQQIAPQMDSGDLVGVDRFPLEGTETSESLSAYVAQRAVPLVLDTVATLSRGFLRTRPQQGEASYTSMIDKDMAIIDWHRSARDIHALIRAMIPWPKATTAFLGDTLFITSVSGSVLEAGKDAVPPGVACGTVVEKRKGKGIGIATGEGLLWVNRLQLEKRKELDWQSFLNGNRTFVGSLLG